MTKKVVDLLHAIYVEVKDADDRSVALGESRVAAQLANESAAVEDRREGVLIRELFQDVVESMGINAVTAENGEEGLATAKENKPDLVFLDLFDDYLEAAPSCN